MAISTFFGIVVVVAEEFCLFKEVTNEDFLPLFKIFYSSVVVVGSRHMSLRGYGRRESGAGRHVYLRFKQNKQNTLKSGRVSIK